MVRAVTDTAKRWISFDIQSYLVVQYKMKALAWHSKVSGFYKSTGVYFGKFRRRKMMWNKNMCEIIPEDYV